MNSNRIPTYQLLKNLSSTSQRGLSITSYYTRFNALCDEHALLVSDHACQCGSKSPITALIQHQQLIQFLIGLNAEYDAVRAKVLAIDPPPSLIEVYELVLQEERRREAVAGAETDAGFGNPSGVGLSESALIAQQSLSITAYYAKFIALCDEYACKCGLTSPIDAMVQDQQVVLFLIGLNEAYDDARAKILATDPPPSLTEVYELVLQEERRRGGAKTDTEFGNTSGGVSLKFQSPESKLNVRPVIGIVSHPVKKFKASYIAASYVRFVQSAGARVIPLFYNEPREKLFKKLSLVNGVLLTGGWTKRGLYYETVEEIFKKVIEINKAGQYFPCYAVCLGFEILTMIISKLGRSTLETYDAKYQTSTLQFVENADKDGTVFQRFPAELLEKLSTECLVFQNHRFGISPEMLRGNHHLNSFFEILTTSMDKNGKEYVSTAQAKEYPITGFQWHPEKNAFEWSLPMIPHSEDAIQVTQLVANFFISEARKSMNRPPVHEVLDNQIYNYSPTYSAKNGSELDEIYYFT